ncbi:MAG: tetratricopeptide repeat protein [Candidatus Acidiferrales bacterium]
MRRHRTLLSALLVLGFALAFLSPSRAQTASHPVTGSELLALVAAESVDQNIVHAIESRALAFRPSDHYRSLLTIAGASAPVLAALNKSKISEGAADPEVMESPDFLIHLSTAGKLIRAKQFDPAAKEITAAVHSKVGPEAGFVMGHLQDQLRDFDNAAEIYMQILEMSPDFPGAHARLAFDLYSFGNAQGAMQEAQAALNQYKDDPEAHKIWVSDFTPRRNSMAQSRNIKRRCG